MKPAVEEAVREWLHYADDREICEMIGMCLAALSSSQGRAKTIEILRNVADMAEEDTSTGELVQ